MASEYKLSCSLVGHSSDVRALATTEDGAVVTSSRDKTTRLWKPAATGCGYTETIAFIGHTGFVTSTCVAPKSTTHPQGLVITGSRDTTIMVFRQTSSAVLHTLSGHTDSVSCLAWNEETQCLASGSWDHVAKVWHNWECQYQLKGHQGPIWSIVFVATEGSSSDEPCKVLTASADKTIKLWLKDKEVLTFTGHTDCVRDIAIIDKDTFLSCSNDACIKVWKITGECLNSYYGHSSFIYSVGVMADRGSVISGGEDRTMRVWGSDGDCIQTIHVPTQSVWCVASLPNGDIVCGSSDGVCRIFTKSKERFASDSEQAEFSEKVAKSTVAVDLGGVKKSEIPGKDALHSPGKKDGQTKMIREGEKVFCYSWSASKFQWEAVGEVVGGAGGSAGTSGKVLYQGREYDYVFDVDLDGENTLKLPYNSSEDPWHVAQSFIHTHELPQTYLDEVAQFIIANANVSAVESQAGGYQDPFTGGNRYVPGMGAGRGSSGGDPFTGSGRYVPPQSTNQVPAQQQANNHSSNFFPQHSTLKFETCNADGILNKFKEFNQKVDSKIKDEQLQEIVNSAVNENSDPNLLSPLEIALQWPAESIWPALDVLRLALRSNKVQKEWIKDDKGETILGLLTSLIKPQNPAATQLLALRCISNMSAHTPGQKVLLNCRDPVIYATVNITPYINKSIEIAAATVLLNYTILLPCNCEAENLVQVISGISTVILTAKDPEAQFRSLVALGTILSKLDEEGQSLAKSLDLSPIVKNLADIKDPYKVGECARHILKLL